LGERAPVTSPSTPPPVTEIDGDGDTHLNQMPNLITSTDLSLLPVPGEASDVMDTADDSKYDAEDADEEAGRGRSNGYSNLHVAATGSEARRHARRGRRKRVRIVLGCVSDDWAVSSSLNTAPCIDFFFDDPHYTIL
jgi:hypothetical protein